MSGLGQCTVILYFISCSNRFCVSLFIIKLSIAISQKTNNILLLFALNILIYTQVSVIKSEKIFFFSSLSCFDVVKKKETVFQCFMFGALLLQT